MTERESPGEYVVECFLARRRPRGSPRLDARAGASADELTRGGTPVRYLGSLLMHTDEVVLCLFEGDEPAVRRAAEQAEVPFERILEAARCPWPIAHSI